jgi:hypothetical protein
MAELHSDLLLLAAVAFEYNRCDIADTLYALAQACTHLTPPMESADIELGLQLIGIESFRVVAPGQQVPEMIWDTVDRGHVVFAQVIGHPLRKRHYWACLIGRGAGEWTALTITPEWWQCSLSSRYDVRLTGHYVAVARTLPGWNSTL